MNEVSIPFKRESGAKVDRGWTPEKVSRKIGFNSLQTGKWSQSKFFDIFMPNSIVPKFQFPSNGKVEPKNPELFIDFHQPDYYGFNSLQTGKWSQSCEECDNQLGDGEEKFQFPSNGKVEPKATHAKNLGNAIMVSIPFKRESGAKDTDTGEKTLHPSMFQFPSNGKVEPKNKC